MFSYAKSITSMGLFTSRFKFPYRFKRIQRLTKPIAAIRIHGIRLCTTWSPRERGRQKNILRHCKSFLLKPCGEWSAAWAMRRHPIRAWRRECLIGKAVTIRYLPLRPDLVKAMQAIAEEGGWSTKFHTCAAEESRPGDLLPWLAESFIWKKNERFELRGNPHLIPYSEPTSLDT